MSAPTPGVRDRLRNSPVGNVFVIAVTLVVVLAGLWIVDRTTGGGDPAAESSPESSTSGVSPIELEGKGDVPEIGGAAPDFTTLSITGEPVILAELAGKPVWLVFGATWCANCRAETPDVQAVHEKYGDDVEIVAVYIGESISTVADFAERLGLTYTQVADSYSEIGERYRVMGLPTHYFIDAEGKIHAIDVGTLTFTTASARLDELLAG